MKTNEKWTRTDRQLSVFHLFMICRQEISYKYITDIIPASLKTIRRDILLLEAAGVIRLRYSRRTLHFVPVQGQAQFVPDTADGFAAPDYPEERAGRLYMDKLRRLCAMMLELNGEAQPVEWYRRRFPDVSDTTRRRDFEQLCRIGYWLRQEDYDGWDPVTGEIDADWSEDSPPRRIWVCDFPDTPEGLAIYRREEHLTEEVRDAAAETGAD